MSEALEIIECHCLVSAIRSKEARATLFASIVHDDFNQSNALIATAIGALDIKNEPIDQENLTFELYKHESKFPNGVSAYLSPLFKYVNTPSFQPKSIEECIKIIREEGFKRRLDTAIRAYQVGAQPKESILEALEATVEASDELNGKSLAALSEYEIDPTKTLLGNRYLCAEGGMLFVGQSGIGKSSASAQMDALWACGKPAFGIAPAKALKILTIQAENDEGDLSEFSRGILDGLEFSPTDRALVAKNTVYISHGSTTGPDFVRFMERAIRLHKPDLVRIDPLSAYVGDDVKDVKAIQTFLRNLINPLLKKYQCGIIVNHHTPKTNFRDTSNWGATDWMYAGAGAADLSNWARAILVIDAVKEEKKTFKFIAAKRGYRIGWADQAGDAIDVAYFKHSSRPGQILWVPTEYQEPQKPKAKDLEEVIMDLIPLTETIDKNLLISLANNAGVGLNKAKSVMHGLIHNRKIFEHRVKRSNLRDKIELARYEPLVGDSSVMNGRA